MGAPAGGRAGERTGRVPVGVRELQKGRHDAVWGAFLDADVEVCPLQVADRQKSARCADAALSVDQDEAPRQLRAVAVPAEALVTQERRQWERGASPPVCVLRRELGQWMQEETWIRSMGRWRDASLGNGRTQYVHSVNG